MAWVGFGQGLSFVVRCGHLWLEVVRFGFLSFNSNEVYYERRLV
jgi:hypothetical protein